MINTDGILGTEYVLLAKKSISDDIQGILSYNDLCILVDTGVITGSEISHVNGSSIDVTLGTEIFREENHGRNPRPVDLARRDKLRLTRTELNPGDTFSIRPREFILAHTAQQFFLPADISAFFVMKSSMARNGLDQMQAAWCNPGWTGSALTLELTNATRFNILKLTVGMAVGQMIFFKHRAVPDCGDYIRNGAYNHHKKANPALKSISD